MKETKTYIKFKNSKQDNFPVWIIVHHSGGTDANPLLDTSNHTASDMESWHLSKGWEGLGYQYVIQKDGEVWKGRPEHYHGAHEVSHNKDSIGICLSGNFDATIPTNAQIVSLISLMKDLKTRYKITNDKIVPHRTFTKKTCYGKKLADDWARNLLDTNVNTKDILVKRIEELLALVKEL